MIPSPRAPQTLALALSLLTALLAAPAPAEPTQASEGNLILLGFDGADGRTVEAMMDAGELPNLSRLREQGTFARLGTSAPAESPVSWASLNTGQNPAKTGVPGFLMNDGVISGGSPRPGFGHLVTRKGSSAVPVEELEGAPIPLWSPLALGGAGFGVTFVVFLIVFAGLLRMKTAPALLLSLVLGGLGGWAGWTVRGYLPTRFPKYENPNQARNLWDWAAEAGVRSVVIDAAQAFDQDCAEGAQVLAGLGLPDARNGLGEWCIYTTDELEFGRPPEGRTKGLTAGEVFSVAERDGAIETFLYGPINFWEEDALRVELEQVEEELRSPTLGYKESQELGRRKDELRDQLREYAGGNERRVAVDLKVEVGEDSAAITLGRETQTLAEGQWSDWYSVVFPLNPILKVHGITRVRVVSLHDPFELYVDKIDLDPRNPPFWQPVSRPQGFAPDLAKDFGPFETYGWSTMTMPFKDKEISPELLLEDVEFTLGWRERLVYDALQRDDWRLFMGVFSTTDRVQHMMYQYYDEGHPLYDAETANREVEFFGKRLRLADAIPEIYRQMDRVVGTVMDQFMGPDDTLIVCSDHGFQSFRTQVHLNNWLVEKGYMKLKDGLSKSSYSSHAQYVDWSGTQAYSFGLGFVYLNLEGREPEGIVPPEEADALLARLKADLIATVDPETGQRVVGDAYVTKEIHPDGAFLHKEADLIVGFAPPYRVSWSTSLGGIRLEEREDGTWGPGALLTDNTSPWSGGHVSMDVEAVRGVFFSNRRVDLPEGGPDLLHIAPTALAVFGVPIPAEMDLEPLTFAD